MPSRTSWAAVVLALLGAAFPTSADSLRVSTAFYVLTLMEFWKHAPSPLPAGADARVELGNAALELYGTPSGESVDPGPAMMERALRLLASKSDPLRIADSTETLGANTFRVREWKDTAYGADSLWRARIYALKRGGILFLASLRYRAGGCGSALFTVRRGLETLEMTGTGAIRLARGGTADGRAGAAAWEAAGSWDALGRMRKDRAAAWTYGKGWGNLKGTEGGSGSGGSGARKEAAAACMEVPPEILNPGKE